MGQVDFVHGMLLAMGVICAVFAVIVGAFVGLLLWVWRRESQDAYWRERVAWAMAPDFVEPVYCKCGAPIDRERRYCDGCEERLYYRERLIQEELSA